MIRHALVALFALGLAAGSAAAQTAPPTPLSDPLLDRLAGTWVLRGTLQGKQTTHVVASEWVLGHQYVRILERSRETDAKGQPQYDAVVLIGWDAKAKEYQCLWLDNTAGGGLTPQSLGRGTRDGDAIRFSWKEPDGTVSFTNTFAYDKAANAWTWALDNIVKGKPVPFGRVTLTR